MERTAIGRSPIPNTNPNIFSAHLLRKGNNTPRPDVSAKQILSDDNEVFVNFQEQLEDLTKQITCMDTGGGDSSDSDVWQMNHRTLSDSVMTSGGTSTLTRRPRNTRAATICMSHVTHDPGSPNEHEREVFGRLSPHSSSSTSSTSKSEEQLLESGVLSGGDRRLKNLSPSLASHGSASSGLQLGGGGGNGQNSASVKNFVQSFEKLKDLGYSNRNNHSPSDLFPAHRSALASKDTVTITNACVNKGRASSASTSQPATISLLAGGSRDKNTNKAKDDKYFSLNGYRNDSLTRRFPEFIRSSQASGSQSKFFLNPKPSPKTCDIEPTTLQNNGTLTRSRGISEDRSSQRTATPVVTNRGQVECFDTCRVPTPESTVSDRAVEYMERPHQPLTRWTMTKHGRDLQKTNSLDSSEQLLMQKYGIGRKFFPAEGFPAEDFSRATSLSKFDDDDEYLMSPPTTSSTYSATDTSTLRPSRMLKPTTGYRPMFRSSNNGTPCRDLGSFQNNGADTGGLNGSAPGLGNTSTAGGNLRQTYGTGPASTVYTSQYATLRLPTGRRNNNNNNVCKVEANEKPKSPISRIASDHGPASPSCRLAEDIQATEIRRLRQDLQWAKEQVSLLTSRLSNNANVVDAFDQSLCNMSQRLHRLTTNSQNKNAELSELLDAVETLRRQNRGHLSTRTNVDCMPVPNIGNADHDLISRQASSDSVTSLTSSATSVCSTAVDQSSGGNPFSRKGSVKNWLRSSFGKAFSRKKHPTKSTTESETVTSYVPHANSMPSISYSYPDQLSMDATYDENHPYCYRPSHDAGHVTSSCYNNSLMSSSTTCIQATPSSISTKPLNIASPAADELLQRKSMVCQSNSSRPINTAHKRSESLDHKIKLTSPSCLDVLLKERPDKDSHKIIVSIALTPESIFNKQNPEKPTAVVIGAIPLCSRTSWDMLDAMIRRLFQEHLIRLDPNTSLGLNGESVYSYNVGEIIRSKGSPMPELLPIGYLIGEVNKITVNLKGNPEKSVDLLSFETLIPKSVIHRHLKLLMEHRRIILSGSTGTGKTYLAQRLAECLVARSGSELTSDSIAVFRVDSQSSKELRQYLSKMASQCEQKADRLPIVVILDNLHHVSSLSDVFSGFLDTNYQNSPYIIGTMNQASCSTTDLQLHHNFRWVLYANHIEPVRTFLGRYLRRQLVPVEVTSGGTNHDLTKVIEWLPRVWQHVNKFLEAHSSFDITIGPRLFLSCPMDVSQSQVWFNDLWNYSTKQIKKAISPRLFLSCPMDVSQSQVWFNDLWNYSIVPYLLEAVREGIQTYGCRAPWEDLADWVIESYPWTKQTHKPALLRLRPEDVGYDNKSGQPEEIPEQGAKVNTKTATNIEKPADAESSLMDILARLQEAAAHSDSDTNSTDGHSQIDKHEGRQSETASLSETNSGGSPPCRTTII